MTLPAWSATGTGSETAPAWPTHASGDLGLCFIEHDTGTVTTPSGWAIIPGFPVTPIAATRLSGFYRFATSGAESAFSISSSGGHNWGVIITYTGVNTLNPFHLVIPGDVNNTTVRWYPGGFTFLDDCMIVQPLAWSIDNAGPLSSGETNADLGSVTERYDAGTITADGGGLVIVDGTKAAKGEFNATQITFSTASPSVCATIALQAVDKTFGDKSRIVNTRM